MLGILGDGADSFVKNNRSIYLLRILDTVVTVNCGNSQRQKTVKAGLNAYYENLRKEIHP